MARIAHALTEGEVIVVSAGVTQAPETLRTALAIGADRAIRLAEHPGRRRPLAPAALRSSCSSTLGRRERIVDDELIELFDNAVCEDAKVQFLSIVRALADEGLPTAPFLCVTRKTIAARAIQRMHRHLVS